MTIISGIIEKGFSFLGMTYSNILSGKGKGKGTTLPIFLRPGLDLFLSRFETKPPPPYVQSKEKEKGREREGRREGYIGACARSSLFSEPTAPVCTRK